MIIDCHTHVNNYAPRPVAAERSVALLSNTMRRFKVDHALVLTSYLSNDDRPGTERVLELTRSYPQLSVVEGIRFQDGRPQDMAGVRRRLAAGQTVGLKMYPGYLPFYPQDKACAQVYEAALEQKVPVMFHTGDTYARTARVKYSHPIHLDDVAVDYPDLKIVLCHVGNPWFRDAAEVIYKNDNVYADISGLVLEQFEYRMERWMAEEIGGLFMYVGQPSQLLYGTDWPLVKMEPYMDFVRGLELSEKHKEMLLWRNTARLFGLGPRLEKAVQAAKRDPRAGKGVRGGKQE